MTVDCVKMDRDVPLHKRSPNCAEPTRQHRSHSLLVYAMCAVWDVRGAWCLPFTTMIINLFPRLSLTTFFPKAQSFSKRK